MNYPVLIYNNFSALLNAIKKRKLDVYFETEEKIMGRATLEKSILEVQYFFEILFHNLKTIS